MHSPNGDMARLNQSREMLDGLENRIKSYLSVDTSSSTMLPPGAMQSLMFASHDVNDYQFTRNKSNLNPITHSRKLSEKEYKLKRRVDSFAKQSNGSGIPRPPSVRDFDAPSRIMEMNRRSDYKENSQTSFKPNSKKYAFISKLLTAETVAYENRIEFFRQLLKKQESEISKLKEELEQAKKTSMLEDQYALPPSLESKYLLIKYRGNVPKLKFDEKDSRPSLSDQNSQKITNKSVQFEDLAKKSWKKAPKSLKSCMLPTAPVHSELSTRSKNKRVKSRPKRTLSSGIGIKLKSNASYTAPKQSSRGNSGKQAKRTEVNAHQLDFVGLEKDRLVKDSMSVLSRARTQIQNSQRSRPKEDDPILNPILNLINSFRDNLS